MGSGVFSSWKIEGSPSGTPSDTGTGIRGNNLLLVSDVEDAGCETERHRRFRGASGTLFIKPRLRKGKKKKNNTVDGSCSIDG
jgi:hypothetical protein